MQFITVSKQVIGRKWGASDLGFIPIVGGVAKESVQAGIKETVQNSAKEATQTIAKKSINDLPSNVQDIYKKYEKMDGGEKFQDNIRKVVRVKGMIICLKIQGI
ncbi:hypothetical protein FL865_14225 [Listeria monocytogenes]|nr:hypothetical protein [Listeria monocytogenes]